MEEARFINFQTGNFYSFIRWNQWRLVIPTHSPSLLALLGTSCIWRKKDKGKDDFTLPASLPPRGKANGPGKKKKKKKKKKNLRDRIKIVTAHIMKAMVKCEGWILLHKVRKNQSEIKTYCELRLRGYWLRYIRGIPWSYFAVFLSFGKILIKNVPQVLKFSQTVPEVSTGYISLS